MTSLEEGYDPYIRRLADKIEARDRSEAMKTDADILRAARKLIETSDRWTKGSFARTAEGQSASPSDYDAVCYCALGAISKAMEKPYLSVPSNATWYLSRALPVTVAIATYNDMPSTGHKDVLALFDRAISLAGASS